MIYIKSTKSVDMLGDEKEVLLVIHTPNKDERVTIPMRSVFQVKRGLESYIQKFYRKAKKK